MTEQEDFQAAITMDSLQLLEQFSQIHRDRKYQIRTPNGVGAEYCPEDAYASVVASLGAHGAMVARLIDSGSLNPEVANPTVLLGIFMEALFIRRMQIEADRADAAVPHSRRVAAETMKEVSQAALYAEKTDTP